VRGEGYGVPGLRCDGMDVVDTYEVMSEAIEKVRSERKPILVEAVTYRFAGHSAADPEEYRDKEQVEEWRERDPIPGYAERLELSEEDVKKLDEAAIERIDEAVAFAEDSDFPPPESIYDHVYAP
jgi:pyruvate dehydrogenase E1 component alpha subunit